MIPKDVIKRIRSLEIRTRRLVNTTFAGEYHSAFKGQGLNFSEVRAYQYGDDVRRIDWNVTARMGAPFVKVFEEERELTMMLMVDVSASKLFGTSLQSKSDIAAEVAAILGFSAMRNNDRVGLILFSDKVESFIPPRKGKNHMFRILRDIFYFEPQSKGTSLATAMDYCLNVNKKKGIVFVISDFMDEGYDTSFRLLSRFHECVPVVIEDPLEQCLPDLGLMHLEDPETGDMMVVNTSDVAVRRRFETIRMGRRMEQDRFFRSMGSPPIRIDTRGSVIKPLERYFRQHGGVR